MARSRYGGYYYGGGEVSPDPLAAAIQSFMGGWDNARQRRIEDEERKRRASIQDAEMQMARDRMGLERERFDAERSDLERRREAERLAAERQTGRMTLAVPDPTGMMPTSGMTIPVPTKAQQEMNERVALERAIWNARNGLAEDQKRAELAGAARALGIEGSENMGVGELQTRIEQAKAAAGTADWKERERFRTDQDIRQQRAKPASGTTSAASADVRAARTEARQAETDYNAMLRRKPRAGQFVDPLTRMPDEGGYNVAMEDWRADSTEKAGAREDTKRALSDLLTPAGPEPGTEQARTAAIKDLQQEEAYMREAIAAEPDRRDEILRQYAERVKAVNARYGIR